MVKKEKTKEQKAARKERRKNAKEAAAKKGAEIIAAARGSGGYQSGKKLVKFTGMGDYRTRTMRGRGDYADVIGDGIGKGASWLARKAGSWLSGLFGMGDYATHPGGPEMNSFAGGATQPVQVHSTKDREFVFRGKEQICDVYSSSSQDGVQTTFDVNPGLENFMEWLSVIAPAFSEWYPNGIVFEYVPVVAPQNADANGKVAMCVSYDNGDPDPGSFKDMSQYMMAIQMPPHQPGLMAGECKPQKTALNWFKVRTGDVAITDEAHSAYDWGKLHIRTGGQTNTGTMIGTLFIVYEIVFQKPLAPRPVGRTLTDAWVLSSCSNAAYMGTSRVARPGCTLELTFSGNNTIVFPSWINHGKFLLTLETQGGSVTIAKPTVAYTGCELLPAGWFPAGFQDWSIPAAGLTASSWSYDAAFEVTAPSATIAFSAGTVPTAAAGLLIITALDTDVTVHNRKRNHYKQYWERKEQEKLQELKYVDDAVTNRIAQLEAKLEALHERRQDRYAHLHQDELPYEEKDEEEPPLRLPRKRVTQEVPDDDDESIVSVRTRTSSKNKTGVAQAERQ